MKNILNYDQSIVKIKRRNMAMLALILGGIIGAKTVPGLTTTTSNPFSSANFHAAFSAGVFEGGYQN